MKSAVVAQLKKLKHEAVAPRAEWKVQNRSMLLSQIKNTLPAKVTVSPSDRIAAIFSIFMPQAMLVSIARPLALLIVVALVTPSLYYGTVMASQEALPGDNLYTAKRYIEKLQTTFVGIVGDQQELARLHVEYAKRRADETSKIITSNNPNKIAQLATTVADLKSEINNISSSLEESNSAKVASDIKQGTEAIQNSLQDAKNNLLIASAGSSTKALADEVKQTKDLVQDVSVKAVEVMVVKHLEGDQSVSKDDVKAALSSAAQSSVDAVAISKQNVDGANSILNTVKTEVKDLSSEVIGDKNLVSSTKAVTASLTTVVTQTKVAVQQTDAATEDATKKANEVAQLVDSNNLTAAVDKIKELSQTSKDVETISDKTIEQTQTVLPLVDVIKGTVGGAAASSTLQVVSTTEMLTTVKSTTTAASGTVSAGTTTKK